MLPSRTANSVHVVHQCAGFAAAGARVALVAMRAVKEVGALPRSIEAAYGVPADTFELVTFHSRSTKAGSVKTAAAALRALASRPRPDLVLSRNLYAAYLLAVLLRRPLVFETHQVEAGARGAIQRAVMTRPHVITVVISEKLREILSEHHGVAPRRPLVLHDAAPEGIAPLPAMHKRRALGELLPRHDITPWQAVCGYFGHLYPGRGIEIIEAMARSRPHALFVVFGGNEPEIMAQRAAAAGDNMIVAGFLPHAKALRAMAACDVLLMPYQASVSIGVKGHDTARWMSPMKMFEYLASGTPIISSDLPVLREVLSDGRTALLAKPDDAEAWLACLDRLLEEQVLASTIGTAGHRLYAQRYTWTRRAEAILQAAGRPPATRP